MQQKTDLFDVHTIVKQFDGHRDVVITWFRYDKPKVPLVPYAEAIRDYVPGKHQYAEGVIDELFSRDQAEQLAVYLDKHHGDEGLTTIKKRELPIDNDHMGSGAIPTGGGPDHYMLWNEQKYTMPFKVGGFFDLRNYERIDGRENIAKFSSLLLVGPKGVRNLAAEIERLWAEHPNWTAEQARADAEKRLLARKPHASSTT
jgi:hypothetical protein